MVLLQPGEYSECPCLDKGVGAAGGGRRQASKARTDSLGCVQLSARTDRYLHMQVSSCAFNHLLCRSKRRRVHVLMDPAQCPLAGITVAASDEL